MKDHSPTPGQRSVAPAFSRAQPTRTLRSREARGVRDALRYCMDRGILRRFGAGKLRCGKMLFILEHRCGRAYELRLDIDAGTLAWQKLLPASSERSSSVKQLQNFLRRAMAGEYPAPLRVDAGKCAIQLLDAGDGLALQALVKTGEFEYCTLRMVRLADELLGIIADAGSYANASAVAVNAVQERGGSGRRSAFEPASRCGP